MRRRAQLSEKRRGVAGVAAARPLDCPQGSITLRNAMVFRRCTEWMPNSKFAHRHLRMDGARCLDNHASH